MSAREEKVCVPVQEPVSLSVTIALKVGSVPSIKSATVLFEVRGWISDYELLVRDGGCMDVGGFYKYNVLNDTFELIPDSEWDDYNI